MTAPRVSASDALRSVVSRIAESHGLELFDVQYRRESHGWVLRVIIDRPPAPPGESGPAASAHHPLEEPVGIEDCQRVSRDLSAVLDADAALTAGLDDRGYTLEVSSPGLDRPLRGVEDYRRFTGRLAKVVTRAPIGGQSHFAGRLAGVDGDELRLVEGHRTHRVPLDAISRAKLDVEF